MNFMIPLKSLFFIKVIRLFPMAMAGVASGLMVRKRRSSKKNPEV